MKKEEHLKIAEERLRDHEYKLLVNDNGVEVWSCKRPDSICYAFNIVMFPMGICMAGDTGELVFDVARGLGFLAGDDVEYYIHSKLSQDCRQTEYDEESIKESVTDNIIESILDDGIKGEIETDVLNKIQVDIKEFNFSELKEYIEELYFETDTSEDYHDFFYELNEFLEKVDFLDNTNDAYNLLDNCEVVEFHDVFEYEFDKPKESLIRRLYMLNVASKKIRLQLGFKHDETN